MPTLSTITLEGVTLQPSDRPLLSLRQGFQGRAETPCENVIQSPPQILCGLFPSNSVSEQSSAKSGFLRVLPPELRNRIYQYVLGGMTISFKEREPGCDRCYDPTQHPNAYRCVPRVVSGGLELNLPLLRVCRQIYNEARLLPFVANEFKIPCDSVEPNDVMRDLVPEQYRAITNLHVEDLALHALDEDEDEDEDIIGTLPNLEQFKLDLRLDWSMTRIEESPDVLFVDLEKTFVSSSIGGLRSSKLKRFELKLELQVPESKMEVFQANMNGMCAWLEEKRSGMLPLRTSR